MVKVCYDKSAKQIENALNGVVCIFCQKYMLYFHLRIVFERLCRSNRSRVFFVRGFRLRTFLLPKMTFMSKKAAFVTVFRFLIKKGL